MSRTRKLALAAVAIGALGFGAFKAFEVPIAGALFERVVGQNVGKDRSAALPDGLHVYICGTGSPMADPDRAGPCLAVLAGNHAMIFDVGSGSMRNLGRMGFPVGRTEGLFLTHLHSDHFDGLGELMVQSWVTNGRKHPLAIMGPAGTAEMAGGFNAAYRIDSTYRTAHHGTAVADPAGYGLAPSEIAIPQGELEKVLLKQGDLTVTAFRVSHAPVNDAYGYRVDYKGRSIALSGDTAYDPNIAKAAKGVDVLFHEALDRQMVGAMAKASERNGSKIIAKILSDIPEYHATPVEAARVAQQAGARALVYYHVIPPMPSKLLHALFLDGTAAAYSGDIEIGHDGELVSLPAGSDAIERSDIVR